MDPRRLAIGPANYAGQANAWVRAVENHLGVSGVAFAFDPLNALRRSPVLTFPSDRRLPHPRIPLGPLRRLQLHQVLSGVTHLVVDGFRAPLSGVDAALARDLARLAEIVPLVALAAHGSDVRDPDAHADRWPWSYIHDSAGPWLDMTRTASARNRSLVAETALPTYVSTPDLLLDLPGATWLPSAIDVAGWATTAGPRLGRGMRVVHLPSRRVPPIKGTTWVDEAAATLGSAITYVSPARPDSYRNLVQTADVVVDQVSSGSYGAATIEALAAGRLVVGNIAPEVRALVPLDIPVVQAEPQELAEVLADVVARPEAYEAMAGAGPGFVRALHDGRRSAEVLGGFLA